MLPLQPIWSVNNNHNNNKSNIKLNSVGIVRNSSKGQLQVCFETYGLRLFALMALEYCHVVCV
jgi:hypothetical protein